MPLVNRSLIPEKLEDPENFADPQTKYLTYKVWRRHLHYTHNLEGDAPERDEPNNKNKAKVAATTWTTNEPWGEQLDWVSVCICR